MTLDTLLPLLGDSLSAVVVYLLIRKGTYRTFPILTAYLIQSVLSDSIQFAIDHYRPDYSYNYYAKGLAVDAVFQFGVLVELFWSVLRPIRGSLPRWFFLVIAAIVGLLGAITWHLTSGLGLNSLSPIGQLNVHISETSSILRILFFLALAGFSQVLSIGWRDRELQIATGLGFFALVNLAVWLQHRSGPQYHVLDQISALSWDCCLLYWAFSFVQQEARRREFTPQMESFFLAVAGTARSARGSLRDPQERSRPRKQDHED